MAAFVDNCVRPAATIVAVEAGWPEGVRETPISPETEAKLRTRTLKTSIYVRSCPLGLIKIVPFCGELLQNHSSVATVVPLRCSHARQELSDAFFYPFQHSLFLSVHCVFQGGPLIELSSFKRTI